MKELELSKKESDSDMLSVVIPTLNAGDRFAELLDRLQEQTVKPARVLIVDSGSIDSTVALAKSHNFDLLTIARGDFDHGTTRNLAVSHTKSEYVVFLTQDAIPADSRMIAELIRPIKADSSIAICYGRQVPRAGAGPLERLARQFNYPPQSFGKRTKKDIANRGMRTFFCSNSCSAVRRSTFDELGGFKDNAGVNEDMLFAAKAILRGYAVYYAVSARVYHSHRHSLFHTFNRYFRIGRFFAENRWLLEHASLGSYGRRMLQSGLKTLWQDRKPHYCAALIAESIVKAGACKVGWYFQRLFGRKDDAHG